MNRLSHLHTFKIVAWAMVAALLAVAAPAAAPALAAPAPPQKAPAPAPDPVGATPPQKVPEPSPVPVGAVPAGVAPASAPDAAALPPIPSFDHIFVIIFENASFRQIVDSPKAPYLNSLVRQGGLAANYHAVVHPSLPNYLALTGGDTFGLDYDCPPPDACWRPEPNLVVDRVEPSGRTWKAYMEDLPASPPCFTGDNYPVPLRPPAYVRKHNPFIYYDNIRTDPARCSRIVPYTSLAQDLASPATTPNYVWITPNMCHDMHDACPPGGDIENGDAWLSQQLPNIMNKPAFTQQRSLVVIVWDEDDMSSDNQVAAILVGSPGTVRAGYRSSALYDHYSLLGTIEDSWGLAALTDNDRDAVPMADFFPVVAAASANPTTGAAPLTVSFQASTSRGSAPYAYTWDFGDATGSSTQNPSHTYTAPGNYTVRLSVRDASGAVATAAPITITAASTGLVARPDATPRQGPAPLTVAFTGSATGGRPPYAYSWDFDDGSPPDLVQNPAHRYAAGGVYGVRLTVRDSTTPTPLTAEAAPLTITVDSACSIAFGAFQEGVPLSFDGIDSTEAQINRRMAITHWFQSWGIDPENNRDFRADWAEKARSRGAVPMITWEPWDITLPDPDATYSLKKIAAGQWDGYIDGWARAAKAYGDPVYLRFAHEMQDGHYPWGAGVVEGQGPEDYIAAWKRVHDRFVAIGATNVQWVWSPDSNQGDPAFPAMRLFYPGDAYVDWLGTTMLNFSDKHWWSEWQTLRQLMQPTYNELLAISSTRPIMIAELASWGTKTPAENANWIREAARTLQDFPRVKAAVWYDNLATPYALDASPEVMAAAREAFGSPPFCASLPWSSRLAATAWGNQIGPLTVSFTGTATAGTPPYRYSWNFGDGTPVSTVQNPSHAYPREGTYTATLTVTDSRGAPTTARSNAVNVSSLSATAWGSSPWRGEPPLTINFTGAPAGGTPPYRYSWNFGDGSAPSASLSASHVYTARGNFKAVLTVTDSASRSVQAPFISVQVPLAVSVAATPRSGTAPLNVSFSTPTAYAGYTWDFGDGTGLSVDRNPTHTYQRGGTFKARLRATDAAGGSGRDTVTITVAGLLTVVGRGSPTSGPPGVEVAFATEASGGIPPYTYSWNFGDSETAAGPSPRHRYPRVGTYRAVVTVTDSTRTSKASDPVVITVQPSALRATPTAEPTSGAAPLTVRFRTNPSGGTQPYAYSWDFGDGTALSTEANPTHQYMMARAEPYRARVTLRDSATPTPATTTGDVTITVSPALAASPSADPTSGTAPLAVQFRANASGGRPPYTYSWNFGDGMTAAVAEPRNTYARAGTYNAVVTVRDSTGASKTASPPAITVRPAPLSAAPTANPTSGAVPLDVQFKANPSGGSPPYTYLWDFADGTSATVADPPIHKYTSTGEYKVWLTLRDAAGGRIETSIVVRASPGHRLHPLAPQRIYDSRQSGGALGASSTRSVRVTGSWGQISVPREKTAAVALNVTVTNTTAPSYLSLYPGPTRSTISNLNWAAGQTVANLIVVQVGDDGTVIVYNSEGSTDFIVDLYGWYDNDLGDVTTAGLYNTIEPSRYLDTRDGTGRGPDGHSSGGVVGPVGPGSVTRMRITDRGHVMPGRASAVVLNLLVTNPTAPSYLAVWPSGVRPLASSINFGPGQTVANRVVVQIGDDGWVNIYNSEGSVDVIADIVGYFTSAASDNKGARFFPISPYRHVDTRDGTGGRTGPLGPQSEMTVPMTSGRFVPPAACAVVFNATATNTAAASYMLLYPADLSRPYASDLNWAAGRTVPNLAVVGLSGPSCDSAVTRTILGNIKVYNSEGSVDILLDVFGYYAP